MEKLSYGHATDSSQEHAALHQLTDTELLKVNVTQHSVFSDKIWYETNPTPGTPTTRSKINWCMTLHDGSKLSDQQHVQRLQWAKILMLVKLKMPSSGAPPSPGTFSLYQSAFKWLISWMVNEGYQLPHEFTRAVTKHYLNDLPRYILEVTKRDYIAESSARTASQIMIELWTEREGLKKFGIRSLESHPFDGTGAVHIGRQITTKAHSWIPPLPDEIAIPLLNTASRFLGKPAEDIIRLLEIVLDPLAGVVGSVNNGRGSTRLQAAGKGMAARRRRANDLISKFEFSILEGETEPWHSPLDTSKLGLVGKSSPAQYEIRKLFETIREACTIILQATTGMRSSEILGIKAGLIVSTGLPTNVQIEDSSSGLYECFTIRSVLSKSEPGLPREVEWMLGMREKGNHTLPCAVTALLILNRLFEPWRSTSKTDRLILSMPSGESLATKQFSLTPMFNSKLLYNSKRFILRWIDLSSLPNESAKKIENNDLVRWKASKGACFTLHMLRKTWAIFTLACDSRLLPAIQMQFHHSNLSMTETGYIGKNPLLVESLNSMSRQKRNLSLYEMVVGKTTFAGRMGEQLSEATRALAKKIKTLPPSEKWRTVVEWADYNQLEMFFSPHANCLPIRQSAMRCHDSADTPIWLRNAPETSKREPNLCAGCACAIMDKTHESFWKDRYIACSLSIRINEALNNDMTGHRVIRFRANQAASILKKFGADLSELDVRIAAIFGKKHAKN